MKIITTTGYGTTGSSVVTDLLKEFGNVTSYGDYEFRWLFDIHGVRELEVALFQLNNRQNSDYYIKAFKGYVEYISNSMTTKYYEKAFDGNFKKLSYEFVDSLIDVEWSGYWHRDIMDEKFLRKTLFYAERFIQKIILRQKDTASKYYRKPMYYAKPTKEKFLTNVQKYLDDLFKNMQIKTDFLALDQLVPPENTSEFLKYFNNNLKIIIVDRDPRDLYLLERFEYKETWVPYQNIEDYIKWYRQIREHRNEEQIDNENVMFVNFEDFIYKYDKTINDVLDFCNIDKSQWEDKKEYFNPDISIKNTKKWLAYPEAQIEIKMIEQELKEFLVEY